MKVALLAAASLTIATNMTPTRSATAEPSARAVGRAGVGLVSEDSGLAMLRNPAGVARRGGRRVALALGLADENTSFQSDGSPQVKDKSGAQAAPGLGYAHGLGERWVVGVAYSQSVRSRRFPQPLFGQRPQDVEQFFPARYAGLSAQRISHVITAGAALRATEWAAIGLSVGGESLEVKSTRSIWAGFSGRESIGDASKDLLLSLQGRKRLVPRVAVGVLVAPLELPFEIAASVAVRPPATLTGTASARATTNDGNPPQVGPRVDATVAIAGRVTAGAGLRYLGDRFVLELGASVERYWRSGAAARWQLSALQVVDESGIEGSLESVDALLDPRAQFRVGAAVDVAIIEGFLWLTGGAQFASSEVARRERSALLSSGSSVTVAAGAEAVWSGFTLTIGLSHQLRSTQDTDSQSAVRLVNPFGDGAGTGPAAIGQYASSADRGALLIEYSF